MTNWLQTSGRITHLTAEERAWLAAQKVIDGIAEIVTADDGEYQLKFTDLPQDEQVDLVQEFFHRFRVHQCVTITWACESGWYLGGGACLISATEAKWNHTGEWATEREEEFYRRQGGRSSKSQPKKDTD